MTKKRFIGIGLMIAGVIGFIMANNVKSNYEVFQQRFSGIAQHEAEIFLQVPHDYQFFFWGVDEKYPSEYSFPEYKGEIKILDKNNTILFDTLFVESYSVEKGGVLTAQEGFYYRYSPSRNGKVKVIMNTLNGDYLDLEVHEDLPESIELTPSLFIFIFIAGIIIYLRGGKKS